jgi:hypothetical protein
MVGTPYRRKRARFFLNLYFTYNKRRRGIQPKDPDEPYGDDDNRKKQHHTARELKTEGAPITLKKIFFFLKKNAIMRLLLSSVNTWLGHVLVNYLSVYTWVNRLVY